MKKTLLLIAAAFVAVSSFAQKVTLDFTNGAEEWGLPLDKANGVTEGAYTNGTYSISLKAAGQDKGVDNLTYFNKQGYLMLGKEGATLTLPAFDFPVGKITVTGRTGASGNTLMNIMVNGTEVSTQTKGSAATNTYAIAEGSQAAGTIYTLAIQSNHNAQITKIEIYEVGEEPTEPEEPENPDNSNDFVAALTDGQGNWTFEDIVMPDSATYIWKQDATYGMKATAYIKGANYASESYLVSPALVLGENSVLTFDHATRYGADYANTLTLWVREEGKEWSQLTIPTYSDGSSWDFVASGNIDLSAYTGKTIQLGWRYTSTADASATWEVKNVKVTNAKTKESAPVLKDPSNTAETAYTAAEAKALIDAKDKYDLSKEVFVKGIISEVTEITTEYGNATFIIEEGFTIFRCRDLDGEKFTNVEALKVGDEVVAKGLLKLYGETYELTNGQLVRVNENTATGINDVQFNANDGKAYDLTGRVANKNAKGIVIINGKKIVK